MFKKTAAQAILESLARENRRVLSDWRATLLLRRASATIPETERRWEKAPTDVSDIYPLLRQMRARGEIQPLSDLPGLYEVTVPYARTGLISEEEVLLEVHPCATLSHLTAFVFHALTDQLPKEITVMIPSSGTGGLLPLDTASNDWEGFVLVRGHRPKSILGHPVRWNRIRSERYIGIEEYRPNGYPVRVTTLERTLVDGLQQPQLCGGFDNVLRAWVLERDMLDLDKLVYIVDQLDVNVTRQRVGYILEELSLFHPVLEEWRARANRGGSSKLMGSAPYAPTYSVKWNLSINFPVSVLQEG